MMNHLKRRLAFGALVVASASAAIASFTVSAPALQVSVEDVNPGANTERDLCLSVSLGLGSASECGDLRLAHALPSVRTLNKTRQPVLLYNSQHASPNPVVAANVSLPYGASGLSRVVATLKVNGTPRGQGVWRGSAWPTGSEPVRIAVSYDAAGEPTGPYRYELEVHAHYGTTAYVDTARGQLAIVNRRESPYGAGWWVAGVEQLVMDPFGKPVLWVGGDGSTRRYTAARGDSVWAAPSLERPDTLKRESQGWVRILPGGVRVRFDSLGRHVATVNRLGHITDFWYGSQGRLDSIGVPPVVRHDGGTWYATPVRGVRPFVFRYASDGMLEQVEAPGVTDPRVTTIHRSAARVDSITDPNLTRVRFGYPDATSVRVHSRTDRRLFRTVFRYDAAWRVAGSRLDLSPTDSIVARMRAYSTVGLADADGTGAVPSSRAYAHIDGPRTDVPDTTALWVNRWGAPWKIADAMGDTTLVFRDSVRYPALPTRVIDPTGFTRRAEYDGAGRLVHVINVNGFNDGRDDTTRYVYSNAKWPDFVTRTIRPEKDSTIVEYDDAGNILWQEDSREEGSRVAFFYYNNAFDIGYAPGLVKNIHRNTKLKESYEYDRLGNLSTTSGPTGSQAETLSDVIGRPIRYRMQIDRAGTSFQSDTLIYDLADRVRESYRRGPAVTFKDARFGQQVTLPAEEVRVETDYDEEGNTRFVSRRATPNSNGIGQVTNRWSFDAAGRRIKETVADGLSDSTVYDPAGNAILKITRNNDTLRTAYDTLGRMRQIIVPARTYAQRSPAPFDRLGVGTLSPFPLFPNQADKGLRVSGDTIEYAYDRAGNLTHARNRDASTTRSYFPNGLLRTDTSKIRTYAELSAGGDTLNHVYGVRFEYDLNGRRRRLHHPSELAPRSSAGAILDQTEYWYDTDGRLEKISDPLGNEYRFGYDAIGRPDTSWLPGHTIESRRYDDDDELVSHSYEYTGGLTGDTALVRKLHSTELAYDARGKLVRSASPTSNRDTVDMTYTGLGLLAQLRHAQAWQDGISKVLNISRVRSDPLENTQWSNYYNQFVTPVTGGTQTVVNSDTTWEPVYQQGVGRLLSASSRHNKRNGIARDVYTYDAAGNVVFRLDLGTVTAAASYYDALGRLRAADVRDANGLSFTGGAQTYAFEEYRYDALGRRVLVRARRGCRSSSTESGHPVECNVSQIRRTLWDGDQELYEVQMPGGDTLTAAVLENDTLIVKEVVPQANYTDATPYYGRVAYVNGPGVDRPVGVIRINYGEVVDWMVPASGGGQQPGSRTYVGWAPFALIPHWDARGYPERGLFASGAWKSCRAVKHSAGSNVCVRQEWLSGWDLVIPRAGWSGWKQGLSWHGTLLKDKRDASDLLYRRNRYYDPTSGRFTQEDPIGIAGGLNLYGYAGGDPVTFSDPYGLSPQACPCFAIFAWAAGAAGAKSTGALVGGALLATAATLAMSQLDADVNININTQSEPRPRRMQLHHIATNKNETSTARGGPWTPEFKPMFDRAGVDMNGPENLVGVENHKGPHPEAYHRAVFAALSTATAGARDNREYRHRFRAALGVLRVQVATPGTPLNRLITGR